MTISSDEASKSEIEREEKMDIMTDKQMQFIAWLITTATDKCQTIDEVREMNKEIRKHSTGFKEEKDDKKEKTD